MKLLFSALVLAASVNRNGLCQQPDSPISTDRPSIAAASSVVPAGAIQIENGMTETSKAGERTFDVPETQVRFGATSRTELRLTLPNALVDDEPTSAVGVADMTVGLKRQFLKRTSSGASVIVAVSVPTGSADVSSHGVDPSVQVPWSTGVNQWTMAGMFSVSAPTQDAQRNVTGQASFLVDRLLTSRWNGFVEFSTDIPQRSNATALLHAGAAFRPIPDHQIDLHAGVGLSGGTEWLVGVGYSLRVGARQQSLKAARRTRAVPAAAGQQPAQPDR